MTALRYGNKPMRWTPTAVRAVSAGHPLGGDELDLDVRDVRALLGDGYALIVELQPGDATRYSVLLSPWEQPASAGFVLTTSGGGMWEPLTVEWNNPLAPADDLGRHFANPWSNRFLIWWAEELRAGTGGAP